MAAQWQHAQPGPERVGVRHDDCWVLPREAGQDVRWLVEVAPFEWSQPNSGENVHASRPQLQDGDIAARLHGEV